MFNYFKRLQQVWFYRALFCLFGCLVLCELVHITQFSRCYELIMKPGINSGLTTYSNWFISSLDVLFEKLRGRSVEACSSSTLELSFKKKWLSGYRKHFWCPPYRTLFHPWVTTQTVCKVIAVYSKSMNLSASFLKGFLPHHGLCNGNGPVMQKSGIILWKWITH